MNIGVKNRDFSIDALKFIAIFLIINSHSDIAYPKYSMLATGGAIGDCLFLFCSGFTLLLGGVRRFDNYYKRRINRIYPSVLASLAAMLLIGHYSFQTLTWERVFGGEFVIAIMVYYVLLWIVRKYFIQKIAFVFLCVAGITLIAYWFFPYKHETGVKGLYGISTLFRWIPYFGVMLLGAYVGIKREKMKFCLIADFLKLVFCIVAFYGIQLMAKKMPETAPLQIVTVPFLFGIILYMYKCCNAEFVRKIYESKFGNKVIMVVGGLCLESYLIQYSIITDKLNDIFPANIFIIFGIVLVFAYVVRCMARLFAQTFRTEDYDWTDIVRP